MADWLNRLMQMQGPFGTTTTSQNSPSPPASYEDTSRYPTAPDARTRSMTAAERYLQRTPEPAPGELSKLAPYLSRGDYAGAAGRAIGQGISGAGSGIVNGIGSVIAPVFDSVARFGEGLAGYQRSPAAAPAAAPVAPAPAPANLTPNLGNAQKAFTLDGNDRATAMQGLLPQRSAGIPNPGRPEMRQGVPVAALLEMMKVMPRQKPLNARDHAYGSYRGMLEQQLAQAGKDPAKNAKLITELNKEYKGLMRAAVNFNPYTHGAPDPGSD